jgi:hypothetical protein
LIHFPTVAGLVRGAYALLVPVSCRVCIYFLDVALQWIKLYWNKVVRGKIWVMPMAVDRGICSMGCLVVGRALD